MPRGGRYQETKETLIFQLPSALSFALRSKSGENNQQQVLPLNTVDECQPKNTSLSSSPVPYLNDFAGAIQPSVEKRRLCRVGTLRYGARHGAELLHRVQGRNAKYLGLGRQLRQQSHEARHFSLRRPTFSRQEVGNTYI